MEAKLYNFVRSDQTKQPYQNLFGLHIYFIICFLLDYKYRIKIYHPGSFKNLLDQNILACYIAMYIRKYFLVIVELAKLIFALYLNCSLGSTFEPCGPCENCLAIKNLSHPDVTEIDAASHTTIEDIKMKYTCFPAFNALLKNLKRPLSNVRFILITAEIKRILTSIITHCRFDLHNIPVAKIMERLNDITNPFRC